MRYCWTPRSRHFPREWSDDHVNAVALYSRDPVTDERHVQLFGVAFDDVTSVRVQVAGEWRSVPLANNGFYLDIPGVQHEDVGIAEATLADGSKQVHDVQQGH